MSKKKKTLLFMLLSILFTYLINKMVFFLATLKDLLYCHKSNYYNWRFGKVFYTKQGSGPPMLLIHDLHAFSSDYEWHNLIRSLQGKYTVYTIDLLGCGRSDKPKLTYTSFLYVQLISDFIKNVIKEKTNVISTGLSSSFIVMSCYQNSDLFGKLLFINPNSIKELTKYPRKNQKLCKFLIESPLIGTLLYNILASKKKIKELFSEDYFSNERLISDKYIDIYHESAHLSGSSAKHTLASINNFYTNINITYALQAVNNSIYIVVGSKAKDYNIIIEEYTSINPAIETSIIEDAKHLPQLEKPEDILEICEIYFN